MRWERMRVESIMGGTYLRASDDRFSVFTSSLSVPGDLESWEMLEAEKTGDGVRVCFKSHFGTYLSDSLNDGRITQASGCLGRERFEIIPTLC